MAEPNGGWVKYLVGVLVTMFITIMMMLGNNVIANDRDSRLRDKEILDATNCKVDEMCKEQEKTNKQILISLAELKSDIKYIKQAVKM
jgi:hypothetical protein